MKRSFYIFLLLLTIQAAQGQILAPVKWHYSAKRLSATEAKLILKAKIEKGWHIYSQYIQKGGPIPTSFTFTPSEDYSLTGKTTESPKPTAVFEKAFNMQILWFENEAVFTQLIKVKSNSFTIKGNLEFMVCNNTQCLPPEDIAFAIPVNAFSHSSTEETKKTAILSQPSTPTEEKVAITADSSSIKEDQKKVISSKNESNKHDSISKEEKQDQITVSDKTRPQLSSSGSLWAIFFTGFLGGLAAFLMPCIYPMIPLTVSFFTKKSGSRAKGIEHAIIYGLSIILIYVALGLLITVIFGASALNEAASSATFNLLFFVILILFAISFLGAFEIILPSSLVNKMDQKSNKSGAIGLFFMAFTLALVSFSCTGPIIGTLLVDAVSKGSYLGPSMGMFGFSSALAIPFTLFAIFPSWLKEMPKSGNWLNTIKVSLGFLELALAFKFLSNVDLAYHWHIVDRDVFLVIWISIFAAFTLYLFGQIRLEHDSAFTLISLPRLFSAMVVLGFTIYMIPGLWGAPLKAISAWLPPSSTQNFDLYTNYGRTETSSQLNEKKYVSLFHAPHGLDAYYDYEQGLAYAKKVNKPVLLDFTGWSCTNCRKMEASVWSDPQVLRKLKENFVLISLYVDDKTDLPESEQYISTFSGKKIQTLGQKWSDLQASKFGTNSQPYYILINTEGQLLVPPSAFDLDINKYIQFLDKGIEVFSNKRT